MTAAAGSVSVDVGGPFGVLPGEASMRRYLDGSTRLEFVLAVLVLGFFLCRYGRICTIIISLREIIFTS